MKVDDQLPPGPRAASRLASLCDRYLEEGGFPDVLDLSAFDRVQRLQDYVAIVILRDVVERHRVENIPALRHLARALFAANANGFSINSLHGAFQSQGIRVGKATRFDYLDHLVDAYLVFLVPVRTRSEKQRNVNPRKVYAIDPGLALAMHAGGAQNVGARLENLVHLEIRRRLGRRALDCVGYYRTAAGLEVDFPVDPPLPGVRLELIQSCAELSDAGTRDREVRALDQAMAETGVGESTIVTLAEREKIEVSSGVIRVLPAWEWVLTPPDVLVCADHG